MVQVRADFGMKGSVGMPGWQDTMRQYLKQDRQEAAAQLSQGHTPGRRSAVYTGAYHL